MKFGKKKHSGDKKQHAKPQLVRESQHPKPSDLRASDRQAKALVKVSDQAVQGKKDLQPTSERDHSRRDERLIFDKIELARNFYWCDELDFYKMRPPVREMLAFTNHQYSSDDGDVLADIFNFLPRVTSAQKHAKRYITYRLTFKRSP